MNLFDMNPFITLTYIDLQRVIKLSNQAGRQGKYIHQLVLIQPKTATQGIDCLLAIDDRYLYSASESEPNPKIFVC